MHRVPSLDALASWTLDNVRPVPPCVVGVVPGAERVQLQLVPLDVDDPLADVERLVAPDAWQFVVLVCSSPPDSGPTAVRIAHVAARDGPTLTEFRSPDGTSRSVRDLAGRLASACAALFVPPPG